MNLFSLFAISVVAFEGIISPLPDSFPSITHIVSTPTIGFLKLRSPSILGISFDTTKRTTRKNAMTIAIIGDSMIDTLGPVVELKTLLKQTYPETTFTILNFGVGGTNIDYGINRMTHGYEYLGIQHPSLVSQKPDLTIVESFAYNPYSYDAGAIDTHWLALAKIVDIIKNEIPNSNIAIAVTIAPNAKIFGDGAAGISFDPQGKREKVAVITKYLESTVKFAQSQHLPLMDAYHPSLQTDGNGNIQYINAGDHIHYSPQGRAFMARIMMDTILKDKLLE